MNQNHQQRELPDGTWVTMLTPFDRNHQVDYEALGALVEWYISHGIDGLFAVCQSSEMFYLSADERERIARFVVEKTAGRIPVVISGHVSDSLNDQISELKRMEACGGDALVLVTNRLAGPEEGEDVWKKNAEAILHALPDCRFGLYECPAPYKRLLSPELLRWCADTGRFVFLKDTCCDLAQIRSKLAAIRGTGLKLYNANAATLLDSLRSGANGFCGIMLNFFPELYTRICRDYTDTTGRVERLQDFSTAASLIELQLYPVNAKYHLSRQGLPLGIYTRSQDEQQWSRLREIETDSLGRLSEAVMARF